MHIHASKDAYQNYRNCSLPIKFFVLNQLLMDVWQYRVPLFFLQHLVSILKYITLLFSFLSLSCSNKCWSLEQIPVVNNIFRDSLKLKASDAETVSVTALLACASLLVLYFPSYFLLAYIVNYLLQLRFSLLKICENLNSWIMFYEFSRFLSNFTLYV